MGSCGEPLMYAQPVTQAPLAALEGPMRGRGRRAPRVAPPSALPQSDRHSSRHDPPNVGVRLPDGDTAVVRHPPGQDALLRQFLSLGVPAQHRGDDLVLLVPPPSDVEPVVAGRDAAAGPLVAELGHQAPAVLQRAVGVQRSHGPS